MNITDFEEYFSPRILERGKEYYKNHHVITLDRIEEGYYEAEVEGSQIYTVFVELEENGEISDISCDCPYDWEEFCKHEAAVLYALREQEEYTPFVEEPEQKQALPEQLAACEKTELIAWMMEYAKENRGFWDYLQLRVSKQLQETEFLVILNRTCNRFFSNSITWKELQKTITFLLESLQDWADDVKKVQAILDIVQLLEMKLEERSCESDWLVYESIADCSDAILNIVQGVVNRQDPKTIEAVYQSLLHAFHKDKLSGEHFVFSSLLCLCALPEYRKSWKSFCNISKLFRRNMKEENWQNSSFKLSNDMEHRRNRTISSTGIFLTQNIAGWQFKMRLMQEMKAQWNGWHWMENMKTKHCRVYCRSGRNVAITAITEQENGKSWRMFAKRC